MNVLEYMSFAIGIIAIAVIIWSVFLGLFELLKNEFYRFRPKDTKTHYSSQNASYNKSLPSFRIGVSYRY